MNSYHNDSHFAGPVIANHTTVETVRASGPNWSVSSVIYAILSVLVFLSNGAVILAFICRKTLRTAFNVYLMNLIVGNFVLCVVHNPFELINRLYRGWWLSFGTCTLYTYFLWVFKAGIHASHTIITINRIWAVMWPHSYRILHRKRVAYLSCLAAWVYVHVTLLPGLVMDAMYYRLPLVVRRCSLNSAAQWQWGLAAQFLVFDGTLVVIVLAYPLIWWKRRQQRKLVDPAVSHVSRTSGRPVTVEIVEMDESGVVGPPVQVGEQPAAESGKDRRGPKKQSHAFTILTILTAGVIVCWTPGVTYYTILCFTSINSPIFIEIEGLLFIVQSALDPVLFSMALPDLRATFLDAFRFILFRFRCQH